MNNRQKLRYEAEGKNRRFIWLYFRPGFVKNKLLKKALEFYDEMFKTKEVSLVE